ncbi:AAA family ATPase [Fodinicola feengrottensis]|uniref:AAA family ATPase n=1 Tax=Fodinicola feengrottensis TaxID=435914 RepID=A0ABN2IK08_9ACTN|nr:AAA family ATPase [Fodinicola feengrottensis]
MIDKTADVATKDPDRLVVVTGGPGAGKTTLIEALGRRGFGITEEAGRAIIREQVAIGGLALPWDDTALFAEIMLTWELRSYRGAERDPARIVFFDRGVPDLAGYLRLLRRPVPAHFEAAIRKFRYHRKVFVAPPWAAIYAQDSERKQTFAEAQRTYEAIIGAYADHGYDLVELPLVPVGERADFVLTHLAAAWPS